MLEEEKLKREQEKKIKTAADTALKEEAKIKKEEYIAAHRMLEEEMLKRKQGKKKNSAAATELKEEAKRTANTPTADASKDEVREETIRIKRSK